MGGTVSIARLVKNRRVINQDARHALQGIFLLMVFVNNVKQGYRQIKIDQNVLNL
jgi:hypothetical protein